MLYSKATCAALCTHFIELSYPKFFYCYFLVCGLDHVICNTFQLEAFFVIAIVTGITSTGKLAEVN